MGFWDKRVRDNELFFGEWRRGQTIANQYLCRLYDMDSWEFLGYFMKINPDLESFFVAIALQHGTHPKPKFGAERVKLAQEITHLMATHEGQPHILEPLRRNYRELGGKLLDTDPTWFFTQLADAYLNWLYMQEESKNLLAESLGELNEEATRTAHEQLGIAQKKLRWTF